MLYIDVKFASMLAPRLRNFKQQKDYLWNFSCPVCGDSKKNKLKARAYIYRKKSDLFCKCHNCGYGSNLGNLIKYVDERMYDEYTLERYESTAKPHISHKKTDSLDIFKTDNGVEMDEKFEVRDSITDHMINVLESSLPASEVRKYLAMRGIPRERMGELYFVPAFKRFVNDHIEKGKFLEPIEKDIPRLIIPFTNAHGKIVAISARAFGDEQPKYYTIKIDENAPKIFGLDKYNPRQRGYVVEGPIDSLFLPNALAVAGSTLDVPEVWAMKSNLTLVPDNEPRNKEIVKQIKKYIERGYSVCLFPETKGKDINEMVLNGHNVKELIDNNTFTGLEAEARFSEWRKC